MGCIQAKGTTNSPNRTIDKLKQQNGYATGSGGGEELGATSRLQVKEEYKVGKPGEDLEAVVVAEGKGEEKKPAKGEKGINVGNVSSKTAVREIEGDELVDGWPKWLVDNIPGDVLRGLVPKTADSYDKLAKVGRGTYSNVYKARCRETRKTFALKKIRFDTSEPESVKFMAREIIILKQLDHPNVIKLVGLATSRMQYSLYLVFDFMRSDLTRVLAQAKGGLPEPQVKYYMQQLLSGLQHCHERGILHRDIKGSNLLIDKKGRLKIADFGLANFYQAKPKRPLTSRVVTLWYRAPELLLGSNDYGIGIDLWSAGCLLAELFVGKPIMPGRNEVEQLHKIFKLCGSPPEDYWKKVKPSTTFRPPSHYKPSFQDLFANLPESVEDLLTSLLSVDPANRGSAASALESKFFTTGTLSCEPAALPIASPEEDKQTQRRDPPRGARAKEQYNNNYNGQRKVSFSGPVTKDSGSLVKKKYAYQSVCILENFPGESSSSGGNASRIPERSPPSPPFEFHIRQDQTAKSDTHPNALKNIQNYPLLLASLAETANHLEQSRLSLNQRSVTTTDYRRFDFEKISKLFVELEDRQTAENMLDTSFLRLHEL